MIFGLKYPKAHDIKIFVTLTPQLSASVTDKCGISNLEMYSQFYLASLYGKMLNDRLPL